MFLGKVSLCRDQSIYVPWQGESVMTTTSMFLGKVSLCHDHSIYVYWQGESMSWQQHLCLLARWVYVVTTASIFLGKVSLCRDHSIYVSWQGESMSWPQHLYFLARWVYVVTTASMFLNWAVRFKVSAVHLCRLYFLQSYSIRQESDYLKMPYKPHFRDSAYKNFGSLTVFYSLSGRYSFSGRKSLELIICSSVQHKTMVALYLWLGVFQKYSPELMT